MKHLFTLFIAFALCSSLGAQNYHILNGDFELWDSNDPTAEPLHWNSFASSDGTWASMASAPHHFHRYGGRPGSAGNSFLTLYTKSIVGVKANGNVTTGRIHAGSMSPSSPDNYNYTQRAQDDFRLPLSATPDSLYVWVSYYAANASSHASVKATLHGDCDFRDPADDGNANLYAAIAQQAVSRTSSSPSSYNWTLLKIPFVYSGNADPAYLLISLSSNTLQGGGDANDSLSVDDMQLIYSAWLNDISMNGHTIANFNKSITSYTVYCLPGLLTSSVQSLTYSTEVSDAVVEMSVDYDTLSESTPHNATVVLQVVAEDNTTTHTYTVNIEENPTAQIAATPIAPQVNLYPNPTSGLLSVSASCPLSKMELVNTMGQILQTRQLDNTQSFQCDFSTFPRGVYYLRLSSSTLTTTRKLVLTH